MTKIKRTHRLMQPEQHRGHAPRLRASGLGLSLGLDFGYHVTNELDVALHIELALAACGPNTAQRVTTRATHELV